ncbi:MAG: hypothetical protein HRU23_18080 [Gammaproteobacteria bacterium]|nr:hypothetical protein [Gammaproteobacteria bacterium]
MKPELSIKLEYLEERKNPAEIFEAMAQYINAYRDLGQVLSCSVGIKTDFEFQLNGIEKGSILSKLSALSGKIDELFESAFYNSGNDLFKELTESEDTENEEQVEKLAADLETSLANHLPQQIVDPHIDRQQLAFVLEKFSIANQKIKKGENVVLIASNGDKHTCNIDTAWRFKGKPGEMFQGVTVSKELNDKLFVKISVNEGNSVWSFRSLSMDRKFSARITDKDWLERYQNGLIPAIGPKDVVEAKVTFDIYTPPKGKGQPKIRNAKIVEVLDIQRNNEYQYELEA